MYKLHSTFPREPGGGGVMSPNKQMRKLRLREAFRSPGQQTKDSIQTPEEEAKSKIGLGMWGAVGHRW